MNDKKKVTLWISVGAAAVVVSTLLVMLALVFRHDPGPTPNDTSNDSAQSVEPVIPLENEKAEALKTEAQEALRAQKFDEARKKYKEAKAMYEADDNQVYASDIDMQLDLIDRQEEVNKKIKEGNGGAKPPLAPTSKE